MASRLCFFSDPTSKTVHVQVRVTLPSPVTRFQITGLGGMPIAITDPATTIGQSDRAFIAISSIA